jgi:hypothetical protein
MDPEAPLRLTPRSGDEATFEIGQREMPTTIAPARTNDPTTPSGAVPTLTRHDRTLVG